MPSPNKSRDASPAGTAAGIGPPGRLLRNWRARPRLVLLIAIPTVTAIALGGASTASSWRRAVAGQRTETLVALTTKITQLTYQIEAERDAIVTYIGGGTSGRAGLLSNTRNQDDLVAARSQLRVVMQTITVTRPRLKAVAAAVAQIGSDYPTAVQAHASAVTASLAGLPGLRHLALETDIPASSVILVYDKVVDVLLAFDDQVSVGSSDPQLVSTAHAAAAISRIEDQDSIERAVVMYGLVARHMDPNLLDELTSAQTLSRADYSVFTTFATAGQIYLYNTDLAQTLQDRVTTDIQIVASHARSLATVPIVPTDWYGASSNAIAGVHNFEEYLATSAASRANDLRQRALVSAVVVGSLIVLMLILSLLLTVFADLSMAGSSRRPELGQA